MSNQHLLTGGAEHIRANQQLLTGGADEVMHQGCLHPSNTISTHAQAAAAAAEQQ
jgi:hypothetical protein